MNAIIIIMYKSIVKKMIIDERWNDKMMRWWDDEMMDMKHLCIYMYDHIKNIIIGTHVHVCMTSTWKRYH